MRESCGLIFIDIDINDWFDRVVSASFASIVIIRVVYMYIKDELSNLCYAVFASMLHNTGNFPMKLYYTFDYFLEVSLLELGILVYTIVWCEYFKDVAKLWL